MLTEELTIQDQTYTLKQRLGWYEQQRIEQAGISLYVDGQTISQIQDVADLPEVEMRPDLAEQNYRRLCTRLVGYKPSEVKHINPAHVPILLARVTQLEQEQEAEIKALTDEHPLTRRPGPLNLSELTTERPLHD